MIPEIKKLDNTQIFQLLWGCALLLMGIAFFLRIPEIINRFADREHFFGTWYVMLSLYLVSIMLVGGGGKKIYTVLYQPVNSTAARPDAEAGDPNADPNVGPDTDPDTDSHNGPGAGVRKKMR